jgi:hypothetical protein
MLKAFPNLVKTSTGSLRKKGITSGPQMEPSEKDAAEFVKSSTLYKEFLAEREEILRHKWIESEKAGHDIGFERALLDWIIKHRSAWQAHRKEQLKAEEFPIPNSSSQPPASKFEILLFAMAL